MKHTVPVVETIKHRLRGVWYSDCFVVERFDTRPYLHLIEKHLTYLLCKVGWLFLSELCVYCVCNVVCVCVCVCVCECVCVRLCVHACIIYIGDSCTELRGEVEYVGSRWDMETQCSQWGKPTEVHGRNHCVTDRSGRPMRTTQASGEQK